MTEHTDDEKKAFYELKERMKGDMEDEIYANDRLFYRFLIARDYDVDNAEQMLRQHLEWRAKYDVKNILSKFKPPEVFEKYFILAKLGYDKEDQLVKYNHFANTDYRGIFESLTSDEFCKCLIYFFEKDILEFKKRNEKLGKLGEKVIYISDMENFSLAKATDKKVLTYMHISINMYLNNYPEVLKTIYVINAPIYFNLFYSVMKPFLPSTVLKKIKVYSADGWKEDLLQVIDAEVLPAFLGGKRTDPDGNPLCRTIIKTPEPVPKDYYKNEQKRQFLSLPDIKKISVPKASVHEMKQEVKESTSHLEWKIHIKSRDIKFGIFYQDDKGKKTEVVPMRRLTSDDHIESGLYKCDNTGTYVAVFDNTDSSPRAKEIYYKIKVKNPSGESSH